MLDSNGLYFTGNTDTVYASTFLDLERDGPTVVVIPPRCGPGTVNDAFFRFVVDMGAPGPDRGKGWFAILRLYGPIEPWFDKTCRPGEIELVD